MYPLGSDQVLDQLEFSRSSTGFIILVELTFLVPSQDILPLHMLSLIESLIWVTVWSLSLLVSRDHIKS